MIYLYWYLGIGVAVIVFVYGAHRLMKVKEPDFIPELLESMNPERKELFYRTLNYIVTPTLAAISLVAVWPLVVYLKAQELIHKKKGSRDPGHSGFTVLPEHLLERLTVQEIESREAVTDPLGAVPELPFGHLNTAWREFLKVNMDGVELWSFSARSQTTWGGKELRQGYAMVKMGDPCGCFLTVWADLSER